ncbi:MAG TPA: amidohydrolase family protein [Pyrinomonadaceae bacterium]|nr:amidohydrolase family protein [Pyrinomonadaceae bacterium]
MTNFFKTWHGDGRRREGRVLETETKPAVLIRNVRVLDVSSGRLSLPSSVLIEKGIINAVYPEPLPSSAADVQVKEYSVIDGDGRVLMPALTDFHVHIGFSNGEPPWASSIFHPADSAREKESYVYAGVTTVVEGSVSPLPGIFSGRETVSPNVFRTGRQVTARGGHPHPMINDLLPWPMNGYVGGRLTVQIEDFSAQEESVRAILEDPCVHHLKIIYDNAIPTESAKLSPDSLRLAVELAHSYGKPAYVHVGSVRDAIEAARAKADVLMHVPFVDKFSEEQVKELFESGVVFVTTSQIWSWAALGFEKSRQFTRLEQRLMPFRTQEAFTESWEGVFGRFKSADFTEEYVREKVPHFVRNIDANIRLLHQGGVTLVAGTDTGVPGLVPGASLLYELRHLVSLGIPAVEVLRSATVTPGKLLSDGGRAFGEVKPGYKAELIIVEDDPLKDVRHLDSVSHIFTQARVFQRLDLQPAPLESRRVSILQKGT